MAPGFSAHAMHTGLYVLVQSHARPSWARAAGHLSIRADDTFAVVGLIVTGYQHERSAMHFSL
jgi:hypothetical protein